MPAPDTAAAAADPTWLVPVIPKGPEMQELPAPPYVITVTGMRAEDGNGKVALILAGTDWSTTVMMTPDVAKSVAAQLERIASDPRLRLALPPGV